MVAVASHIMTSAKKERLTLAGARVEVEAGN